MSDTPGDFNLANSKANLIEVHHVGVTAKLHAPLKKLLPQGGVSSSTESDNTNIYYGHSGAGGGAAQQKQQHKVTGHYDAFVNDTQADTEYTEATEELPTTATEDTYSRVLYEMRAVQNSSGDASGGGAGGGAGNNLMATKPKETPARIEFQRYHHRHHHGTVMANSKRTRFALPQRKHKTKKLEKHYKKQTANEKKLNKKPGFFQRLRRSLRKMCECKPQPLPQFGGGNSKLLDGLPEPEWTRRYPSCRNTGYTGIYPFDHGCADYLSITDQHPKINAVYYAERANVYATHFWAEVFGCLHIAFAFVVAFVLQCYRFVLYALVNTLFVGLLHMTSDYLIKPILTAIFNGFLQPPLIFIYNILSSLRDLLEPIAMAVNNFMKPIATVGRSLRFVHVSYNQNKTFTKEV